MKEGKGRGGGERGGKFKEKKKQVLEKNLNIISVRRKRILRNSNNTN